jgi:hypothetical protein
VPIAKNVEAEWLLKISSFGPQLLVPHGHVAGPPTVAVVIPIEMPNAQSGPPTGGPGATRQWVGVRIVIVSFPASILADGVVLLVDR